MTSRAPLTARRSSATPSREAAMAQALSLWIDPRLVLRGQMLNSRQYQSHEGALPDFEKRVCLMSAEYCELQKSRPIEVVLAAAE